MIIQQLMSPQPSATTSVPHIDASGPTPNNLQDFSEPIPQCILPRLTILVLELAEHADVQLSSETALFLLIKTMMFKLFWNILFSLLNMVKIMMMMMMMMMMMTTTTLMMTLILCLMKII